MTASTQTQSSAVRARLLCGGLVFFALALLGLLAFRADDAVINWIHAHRGEALQDMAGTISHYGDWPFLMAAGVLLAAICWRIGSQRVARLLVLMMVASTLAGIAANTLRLTTGRTRPN